MKNYYHVEYKVYRDGKSRAVLPTELEALEYLKNSALRHAESDYVIEKRKIIFDSHENAGDRKRLTELVSLNGSLSETIPSTHRSTPIMRIFAGTSKNKLDCRT
jgi:hypothetical protein